MRILFDQPTPLPLRDYLDRHEVRTASQERWDSFRNGELLAAAQAAGFDVFVTTDKNLNQQNLRDRKIAIVVLGRQQWPEVRFHAQRVVEAINATTPGSYAEIDIPSGRRKT